MQLLLLTLALLNFSSLHDSHSTTLVGYVSDYRGQPVVSAKVKINELVAYTNSNGAFTIQPKKRQIYQIRIKKTGYYQSTQTFSQRDLTFYRKDNRYGIPPITLVARKKGRTLFAFGGDVMMGRRYRILNSNNSRLIGQNNTLSDAKSIIQHIKSYLEQADISIVNLETQIMKAPTGRSLPKRFTFYSPPETLPALEWAGVDYVTIANNHIYDYGEAGLASTLFYLNKSHLGYSGAGFNKKAALSSYVFSRRPHMFSILAYVGRPGKGDLSQVATSDKGGAAFGTDKNILDGVVKARKENFLPVIQYHGGSEYSDKPTEEVERRLRMAIDKGAVMAIAHHPHVSQGIEIYQDKLIAFSLGNLIFDQDVYSSVYSYILYVWMDGKELHHIEIIPIYIKGYRPTPATDVNRYTVLKRLRALSSVRGTRFMVSGFHAVYTHREKDNTQLPLLKTYSIKTLVEQQRLISLSNLPWNMDIAAVHPPQNQPFRRGILLSNGGDFEHELTFDIPEKNWTVYNAHKEVVIQDDNNRLLITPLQSSSWVGMSNFRIVFCHHCEMSFTAELKPSKNTKVKIYWQGRKKNQNRLDTLASGAKHFIGEYFIWGNKWNKIVSDFVSPDKEYRGYRILIEIDSPDPILIDNIHLIEWQTTYAESKKLTQGSALVSQTSYIEFMNPISGVLRITLGDGVNSLRTLQN